MTDMVGSDRGVPLEGSKLLTGISRACLMTETEGFHEGNGWKWKDLRGFKSNCHGSVS